MPLSSIFHRRSLRAILRSGTRWFFGKGRSTIIQGWRFFFRLRIQLLLRSRNYLGKLARRTEVFLWVDGKEAFPRMEKLFNRAEHTIIIQMYIWKDDSTGKRIASSLLKAADRGVKVYITKEATGDAFELHKDFLSTAGHKDRVWQRFWSHPNIRIEYATEYDHAKVCVIDNVILLLAGMNIADEYWEWHDYMVELRGSRFVDRYLTEGEIPEEEEPIRLVLNTADRKEMRPAVIEMLSSAKKSILLEQCYISDPEVVHLLAKRSCEGIRVTLIIPERADIHHHANMHAVDQLLSEGDLEHVRIFLYPGIVHGKVILVDNKRAFVGSANLMTNSLDVLREVNVFIEGRRRALHKLRDVIRRDILRSKPMLSPPKLKWIGRMLAWLQL